MRAIKNYSSGLLVALLCMHWGTALFAAGFTITGTTTSNQTFSSGTGTVTSTGLLSVNNTSTVTDAIDVTGNATLINSGTIQQTTTSANAGRAIRVNTANVSLTITNNAGALIQAADADPFQINKASDSVTMYNYGTVNSLNASAGGAQAIDWSAINTGANTLYNYSTGLLQASEADAVRPGVNGVVYNYGQIKSSSSTGSSSDGIDVQTNSGIQVTNYGTGLIEGARHGITGGTNTFTLSVTNNSGGIIKGDNGSGINIDGFNANETVTINNDGTITGKGVTGDGDGVDVDGVVNVTNTGTIKSLNSAGAGATIETSEGITVGGGTIINSGTIEGDVVVGNTTAVGRGITLAGVDKDTSGNSIPLQGIYVSSTITNTGLIKGQSDSGIAVGGSATAFTVTINNLAGGIIEGGGTAAAILTGSNNSTINNAGTIIANASGKAIDFGAGNDTLNITGGSASITGDISGGSGTSTMTVDPGIGHSFNYAGAISNFSGVEIKSGTVTLSGSSNYNGITKVSGGKLVITGSQTASVSGTVAGGSTLQVDGLFNHAATITVSGTLKGVGSVGAVSTQNGGTLAPGNSPGILTVSNGLSFSGSQASLSIVLGKTTAGTPVAGTDYSQVNLTGGILTLNNATLTLSGTADPLNVNDLFFVIINGGGSSVSGIFNGLAQGGITTLTENPGVEFQISYTASASGVSFSGAGNDVALKVIAIPEPSTWACILIGSLFLLSYRRRQNRHLNYPKSRN